LRSTASAPQIWIRTGCEDAKVTPTSWHYAGLAARVGGARMKLIRCECGFVARGDSDDQVVGMIRGHMATDHPALLDTVSREDLVSWVQAE
jgi:predicted small metal-binding protein